MEKIIKAITNLLEARLKKLHKDDREKKRLQIEINELKNESKLEGREK